MMSSDDKTALRKKGLEYLLANRRINIGEEEFTVKDLMPLLGLAESSVYPHMQKLVEQGMWGTRVAYNPETCRYVRVWWIIEDKKKEAE